VGIIPSSENIPNKAKVKSKKAKVEKVFGA
jgi:hypothetical protein